MPWPLSQDYNEAVQSPESSFADPELRGGEVATNAMGLPMPCSGNFADVYRFNCAASKRSWAVKCFTRQIRGLQERYQQISRHLEKGKPSFIVDFTFLDRGIQVRGDWYPILKMQWVEGLTLNQFVKGNLDKPQVLDGLCQLWVKLAVRLREANIAHCDLQHGNVLLVPGDKPGSVHVRLVDYDGMCVPALTLLKSMEVGHPSYQHPQRLREGIYSLEVDRFSHLVIYTALRSLMVGGKALWDKHDDGDNLLFKQADFEAPAKSPLFYDLLKLDNPAVRPLVEQMIEAVRKPLDQTPLLEDLVAGTQPAPLAAQTRIQSVAVSSRRPPTPQAPASKNLFAPLPSRGGAFSPERKQKENQQHKALRWYGVAGVVGLLALLVGGLLIATRKSPETKPVPVDLAGIATRKNPETKPPKPKLVPHPDPAPQADPPPKRAESDNAVVIDPKGTPKAPADQLPPRFTNSLGMEFALIPRGKARLGGGDGQVGDKEVEIPREFYLGMYEVTQEEWQKVMGNNPSHFSRTGESKVRVKDIAEVDLKRFPVEGVSWDDCQEFVTRLNETLKESGWAYRLPTDLEWEYACRGGPLPNTDDYGFDFYLDRPTNALPLERANFAQTGVEHTCQVGSYPPNRLGLYDMHGNVWEWCADEHPTDSNKDTNETPRRVHRGGAWNSAAGGCRASNRYSASPSERSYDLGLRLARVPVARIAGEDKTSETWSHVHVSPAQIHEGIVEIKPQSSIWTKESYSGPIEIKVVARTKRKNIRLFAFAGGMVIFNWERNLSELRIHRPDGNDRGEGCTLGTASVRPLAPNTWYELRWRIGDQGMTVAVDDKVVFSEKHRYNLSFNRPVGINAFDSIVEVQTFVVRRLNESDQESKKVPDTRPKPTSREQPVPGLLHHYRFEEGEGTQILDALTNSPDGTHNARYSTDVPTIGRENRFSLAFNGTAVAQFPQQVFVLHRPYGDATLDFWLKVPVINRSGSVFWSRSDAVDRARFNISVSPGPQLADSLLTLDYRSDGSRLAMQRTVLIPTNKWTHIAVIRKQNKGKSDNYQFFVNGKQAGSTLDQKPQLPVGVGWTLNGRDGWPFTGLIDEVRLWDRAIPMSVLAKH